MFLEQPLIAVIFKSKVQLQIIQPARRGLRSVEMDLRLLMREVVGIAVQFERGATANGEGAVEKRLKRDDKLLPGERTARAAG
jgi:hypothetical protein